MALQWKDRVLETSTTTGTGALTLAGAVAGFRTFASVCSVSDTVYYFIEAVNSQSVPTGEWEAGLGTYSGANTLTRTTVHASSNGGAAVNFSAGTKRVGLSATAAAFNAGNITNTPAGTIAATTVQAAVNELDTEKVAKAGDTITGNLGVGVAPSYRLHGLDSQASGHVAAFRNSGGNKTIAILGDSNIVYGSIGLSTPSGSALMVFTSDNAQVFEVNSAERMRVDASGNLQMGGTNTVIDSDRIFRLRQYTVATLPAGTAGMVAAVTDALSPTFLATVTGGGSVNTPVYYNGTNWVSF